MASVAPDLKHRVLTMNGVSKAYAMTGWRIGYAGGPEWLIKAMSKYMGQTTSNPASISQWAAVAALDGPQDFLSTARKAYGERRRHVVAAINDIEGLTCRMPEGAFYAFFDCSSFLDGTTYKSDADFALALLEATGVALVPGSAFHSVDINIGIKDDSRKASAEAVAKLMADTYTLYLKTHGYHWNVEGPHFQSLWRSFPL